MLENLIYDFGYLGILLVSFISSTLVPASSDVFVVLMIGLKYNPLLVFIFATVGNVAGGATNYYIGKTGRGLFGKKLKTSPKREKRVKQAKKLFDRYGGPILFFSWVPIIGDPLCIVPGIVDYDFKKFLLWTTIGKALRYAVIIIITLYFIG